MKSGQYFVKQVADTIKINHGHHDGSFIFGISGKWGEWKTTFLKYLEKNLENDYQVIWIDTWKFAADKISFLRNF